MPTHKVFFSLPKRELGYSDIVIEVYADDEKHGTITISKGALEWWPSNAKKPYSLGWDSFDKMVKKYFGE